MRPSAWNASSVPSAASTRPGKLSIRSSDALSTGWTITGRGGGGASGASLQAASSTLSDNRTRTRNATHPGQADVRQDA